MLNQMQSRFQTMSDNIINRIDEMGGRIDDLEKSISDLVAEAQSDADGQQNKSAPKGNIWALYLWLYNQLSLINWLKIYWNIFLVRILSQVVKELKGV